MADFVNKSALPIIYGLFGNNVDFRTLLDLVVLQVFENPDNLLRIRPKDLLQVITEELTPENSWSDTKSKYQSIFQKLNSSDEVTFYAYLSFVWYSSLPCFDVENFTSGIECKLTLSLKSLAILQKKTVQFFKTMCSIFACYAFNQKKMVTVQS